MLHQRPMGRRQARNGHPIEKAADVLHSWHDELPSYPDELMTWAALMQFPPLPFVPEHLQGRAFAVVLGAFDGDEDAGRSLLGPIRRLGAEIDTFATVRPWVSPSSPWTLQTRCRIAASMP